ncbi:chromosome partitioning protein ParB, partial [Pseudomonas aeruginosa]
PVSHAKPEGQSKAQGQGETNTPAAVTTPSQEQGPAAAPNSSSKKNGKGYIPITAERQVIGIKVALDSAVASGYLMNDRVSEDPSKAWCMLMIGGSQQPKQIKVDQIDIVSVAAMETDG